MKSTAALPRARKGGLVIKELSGETLVYEDLDISIRVSDLSFVRGKCTIDQVVQ